MYISRLEVEGQKDPVEIKKKQNILIIGDNGVGKTYYLNKLTFFWQNYCKFSYILENQLKDFFLKIHLDYHSWRPWLFSENILIRKGLPSDIFDLDFHKFINLIKKRGEKSVEADFSLKENVFYKGKYLIQAVDYRIIFGEILKEIFDTSTTDILKFYTSIQSTAKELNNYTENGRKIEFEFHSYHNSNSIDHFLFSSNIIVKISDLSGEKIVCPINLRTKAFKRLSDGEKSILLFWSFLNAQSLKIFLWDEPELHLHPIKQEKIFKSITESPAQFIITTHSPFILKQALQMKDKWIVLNMTRDSKIKLQKFNEIKSQDRKNILDNYGIPSSFIIVEGELDKKYLEVCFKSEPYYKIIPIEGKDSITKAPKGFKILLQEIYQTWKMKAVFIKDQDDKKGETKEETLKKVFTSEERDIYHCLLSNHGHDQNLKDIEQVIVIELDKNATEKKEVENELRLSKKELEDKIPSEFLDDIEAMIKKDPLIFFKGSKKSIKKNVISNLNKNSRNKWKNNSDYFDYLINNRKEKLCTVLTKHYPKIVKAGLKNLVNAIKEHYGIDLANSHISE